jgi:hypothetical protein
LKSAKEVYGSLIGQFLYSHKTPTNKKQKVYGLARYRRSLQYATKKILLKEKIKKLDTYPN